MAIMRAYFESSQNLLYIFFTLIQQPYWCTTALWITKRFWIQCGKHVQLWSHS